ncbi:DUF3135 domain-containing protein [Arhodomonas sp. SL1]|uniref:DUF3135 domain-containing protein n=1 Tax=Arhodomonas sp. SL1 TaxID=3425691 RepID=UPI003F882CA8
MDTGPCSFDEWASLARSSPEAFEAYRRDAVDRLIAARPARRQTRLRRLQWRIDRERERADTPLGACVRIYGMMWERFAGADGLAERLNVACGQLPPRPRRRARVISFPYQH